MADAEQLSAVGPRSPDHDPSAVGPSVKNEGEAPARFDTTFTPGKIFVGGLSSETTEADLKEYFSVYGNLTDIVVMRDKLTGNGRGFGFVTFEDRNVADRVVAQRHEIRGRTVEAKLAVPRNEGQQDFRVGGAAYGGGGGGGGGNQNIATSTKIFVGGLAPAVEESDFRAYFENFGKIVDCQIMLDHHTQRSRGFGFVTYEDTQMVDVVMSRKDHSIKGKEVEIKRAFPRGDSRNGPPGGGRGGPMLRQGDRGGGGYDNWGRGGGGGGGGGGPNNMMPQMMQMYQMMMMATQMAQNVAAPAMPDHAAFGGGGAPVAGGGRDAWGAGGGGGGVMDQYGGGGRDQWAASTDQWGGYGVANSGGGGAGLPDMWGQGSSAGGGAGGGGGMQGMDPASMYQMYQQMQGATASQQSIYSNGQQPMAPAPAAFGGYAQPQQQQQNYDSYGVGAMGAGGAMRGGRERFHPYGR